MSRAPRTLCAQAAQSTKFPAAKTAAKNQLSMPARRAALQVLIKMAQVVITFKILPESTEVNLKYLAEKATELISEFGGKVGKTEEEPIAFGIKALKLYFVMDESKGATEAVEEKISALAGVNSIEVVDVRRTIG